MVTQLLDFVVGQVVEIFGDVTGAVSQRAIGLAILAIKDKVSGNTDWSPETRAELSAAILVALYEARLIEGASSRD